MSRNPILDELYAARAKLLADAEGDIDRLLAGIRRREAQPSRRLVQPTPADSHSAILWVLEMGYV